MGTIVKDGLVIWFNPSNIDNFGNNGKSYQDSGINPTQIQNLIQPSNILGQLNNFNYNGSSGFGQEQEAGSNLNYLLLDGENDNVVEVNTSSLNLSSITIQLIVKIISFRDYLQLISSRSNNGYSGLFMGTDGTINNNNLTAKIYKNPSADAHINTNELSTGIIYNLCITANSSAVQSFINGGNNQSGGATGYSGSTDNNFCIGATAQNQSFPSNFKLYDLKVYNRVLIGAEVSQNNDAGIIQINNKKQQVMRCLYG